MYVITGITGKVGGALANALLDAGLPVRAVVRNAAKAASWAARGCEIALAEMEDTDGLMTAFEDAEGVFILPPSDFDPEPGYPEARRVIESVRGALEKARPGRVVCLSTIGADASQDNLLTQRTLMERALTTLSLPITFLRPAWFLDNASWDVTSAREEGVIHSFLMPIDKGFPMVASKDVGCTAAALIRERWNGVRVIQLEGPARVSPKDLAAAFSAALGHPVHTEMVRRETWEELFRAQGMRNPEPRIRMLDGFNEGWIDFPERDQDVLKGKTNVTDVVTELVREVRAGERG